MNIGWLDFPTRIIHALSLLTVACSVAYMILRDRQHVPVTIRRTQVWFVLYISWICAMLIATPLLSVTALVLLRAGGAGVAAVFAFVIVRHVQQMRAILHHEDGE